MMTQETKQSAAVSLLLLLLPCRLLWAEIVEGMVNGFNRDLTAPVFVCVLGRWLGFTLRPEV